MIAAALSALVLAAGARLECPPMPVFTVEAASLVGDPLHGGIFGYASRQLILRPDVCDELGRLASGYQPTGDAGWAGFTVFTLAHELAHAGGVTDETAADCAAAAGFRRVAAGLGVPGRLVMRMMRASAVSDGYQPGLVAGCWPWLGDPGAR